MKAALMIIDMQKAYYGGPTVPQMDAAVEYINAVIPFFREKGLPVVWVYNENKDEGVVPGNDKYEFIDALKPQDGDIKINKTYDNGFNKTNADKVLKDAGVDTVVVTGFCAEQCVLSTYRGAEDLDYFAMLLKNGIASVAKENKEFVENISETVTYGVLKKMIEQS
jgi:nicotinamidase-related amidase